MFWNIDGEEIEVLLREQGSVEVVRWEGGHKIVHIPAKLSKAEAVWSLRNLLREHSSADTKAEMYSISMFDRNWAVVHHKTVKAPFIKKGIIHCCVSGKILSPTQENQLKLFFFTQWISQCVGKWEEYFDKLLPDITLRKNSKSPFTLSRKERSISFDKDLVRFNQEHIDYCVFLAVSSYLDIDQSAIDHIGKQTYADKRSFDKILEHEYSRRNSD